MSFYGPIDPVQGVGGHGPNPQLNLTNLSLSYYRQVPSATPGGRTYRYYDIATGDEISLYQYRRYLASLTSAERQYYDQYLKQTAQSARGRRQDIYDSYRAQSAVTGQAMTGREFNLLSAQLRTYSYQEGVLRRQVTAAARSGDRTALIASQDALRALTSPGGQYAATLVALGRRPPDADWMVGVSGDNGGIHQGPQGQVGTWVPNSYTPGERFYQ